LQVSHTAEVLKTKVADLSAPPQEQGAQGQHRGDVTDADVRDMDTPGERKLFWRGKIRLKTIIHGKNTPFRPLLTRGRYFSLKKMKFLKPAGVMFYWMRKSISCSGNMVQSHSRVHQL